MRGLVFVAFVLSVISVGRCLPTNLGAHAELSNDMTAVLLPHVQGDEYGYDDIGNEILDREERGLSPLGSGSGPLPGNLSGLTDDEDLVTESPQLATKPEVLKLAIASKITARFSSTEVRSKLKNIDKNAAEAKFTISLPDDAFISAFSMTIDNVIYHSEVKPKDVAQREYNEAKAKGQTAGQVKQSSPDENKFTVSVTVEARKTVLFNLTYEQLLKRKNGIFEQRISIQPGQMVPDVRVEAHITEPQGLKEVNASWAIADKSDETKLNNMTEVQLRPRSAKVLFDSRGEGLLITSNGIMGDFIIKYDVMHDVKAGHLQIVNGYFVHYFSPEGLPKTRKNVVFVIDVSGSMRGRKIEQTKTAFTTILDDVRPIDRINIVLFESSVRVWRANQMVEATRENIATAKRYVNRLSAGGGTNLYDGLTTAVDLLTGNDNDDAMPLIIMLTDGQPTSGAVTITSEIVKRITNLIEGRLSLFSVGFGNGVDFSFLEKLSLSNQALARKVYEDSSASVQMKGFYDEVANPLLFNINLEYSNRLVDEGSLTQSNFMAYFDGTEITVAGKLKDEVINAVWNSANDMNGPMTGENRDESDLVRNETILASAQHPNTISIVDGNEDGIYREPFCVVITGKSLDVDIEFNTSTVIEKDNSLSRHEVDDFAQRLWAYLTIKNLLDERKTVDNRKTKAAISERALNLSLKYHFVTPLTSLLVVKPDDDTDILAESVPEVPSDDMQNQHSSSLYIAPMAAGPAGPQASFPPQRRLFKGPTGMRGPGHPPSMAIPMSHAFADSDPHFMVEIPQSDLNVCFDINGDPGDVFNLLNDSNFNLQVSAYVIPVENDGIPDQGKNRTYFGKIGVLFGTDRYLVLTPTYIEVNSKAFKLDWDDDLSMRVGDFDVHIRNKHRVVINHGDDVVVVIMAHRVRHGNIFQYERERAANRSHRVDHLGFYVENGKGLSKDVHGLIGQFYRKKEVLVSSSVTTTVDMSGVPLPLASPSQSATLFIDDRHVPVKLINRRIPLIRDYKECWHAADNAKGLIEGDYTDYKLPSLLTHVDKHGK
ncbi:inter-alpha-trypsin inhibitor heavy chain H3-like [Lytechinus pictus]|uniref:inter-alpha-trypsin inhibitor heavy chain H3-like n=1 Tax=Lytechinus pictus TaxID=7653 RepID=UPI0030B9F4C2